MIKHSKIYSALISALSVLVLSAVSNPAFSADNNNAASSVQAAPLGQSTVPYPMSSGTIPAPINNLGSSRMPGVNPQQMQMMQMPGQQGMMPYYNQYGAVLNTAPLQGQPAWSQGSYYAAAGAALLPFGASLFQGNFANTYSDSLNPSYRIAPGDRIVIRVWGARQYDDVLSVDQQGNIFIPEVGPIAVMGITNGELQSTVKARVGQIFTSNVEVYVNLLSSQPVGIYVTGFVMKPGQYAGGAYDSLLTYLDRAGGIDFRRGSFRNVQVKRNGSVAVSFDLYDFILHGNTPQVTLRDGDVIVVAERQTAVSVRGDVREEAVYELSQRKDGAYLSSLVSPDASVTHVSISGNRNKRPINRYLSLEEFSKFSLEDGDVVTFASDVPGSSIIAKLSGAIEGLSHYPVSKDCRLRDLLSFVEIDPDEADIKSIYIKRRAVAEQQKQVIQDALRRLEQSALTATSASVDEAEIRVQEASLIQDFVKRAGQVEPDGIVVVSRAGVVSNIRLEDGDEIVIPQKTDVVLVAGEVMMPKAVAFDEGMKLDDYLGAAGGVSNRADDENILVAKANGEVGLADDLGIEPGDQILVLPKFDTKNMQLAKDVMQILYQIAVATKVAVDL